MLIRLTPLTLLRESRHDEPVTVGVPLPKGACIDPESLQLEDAEGRLLPVQIAPLDRWPDGSLRWVLVDARLHATAQGPPAWRLRPRTAQPSAPGAVGLTLTRDGSGFLVETGCATFAVRCGGRFPVDRAEVAAGTLFAPGTSGLRASTVEGAAVALIQEVRAELDGPLRAVLLLRGEFEGAGPARGLRYEARLHFHAGSATLRLSLTIHNPRRARHRGNRWPLGDPGSVQLRALELSLGLQPGISGVRCRADREEPCTTWALPFSLYQDSSGGDHWDSPVHRNRAGVNPMRFRGWQATGPGVERRGLRASPVVTVHAAEVWSGVALPAFWENCPRAVSVATGAMVIGLFPGQHADLHELQGGEQKTHEIVIAFGRDAVSDPPLAWCHDPLRLGCDPEWYAEAGALPFLTPAGGDPGDAYHSLVRGAVEGPDTFQHKRERIDEYGWRHFGDLYADHEAVFQSGPAPLVSHYNNQYDAIGGCATQFFRDRDARWWTLMDDLARHVADIDIYRTTEDKAAYNQGLFWHTTHYLDAGTATHRAYPAGAASAGGPSAEHNYTTGLMLHYFLTGHQPSREAAITLAEWVIAMDDGGRTWFRFLARGHTGLASSTWSPDYHGPGRGAGNSILACLNAWRLTGERRFAEKAEQLIRRCIHPSDDPAGRDLLDAERRWSYTVFLQSLGVYLLEKAERGAIDHMYEYARASLRRYAGWMARAERPYLDHPAMLEYPNETWAAQDIRKSEVLEYAALHSAGAERQTYLARADFFFESSTRALRDAPTSSLTRPTVLMLSYGWRHAWFVRERDRLPAPAATPGGQVPPAERFRPQKRVALRRAGGLAVGALSLIVALALLFAAGWP